ncbi:hypothetical protein KNT87_gp056 [Erwinia phage Cronus]|uniref:Uncharacterized protein n=1 Tax=Erwinia phage Cronus TaxID=2163633 RepID=A0A2S1GM86_9CAUD|nr:hypothetical protein KNT87_gp056 [Erwinia phage Cronus]AWD90495.1 hypothetical protein [Erwinia phage Cronus]
MKVKVIFKSDNGFKPYCTYHSAAYRLCAKFGPTLKPAFIGGKEPIWPLPEKIGTDMDIVLLFQLLGAYGKSVRVCFDSYSSTIELTVPGYREEWLTERAKDD